MTNLDFIIFINRNAAFNSDDVSIVVSCCSFFTRPPSYVHMFCAVSPMADGKIHSISSLACHGEESSIAIE